MLHISTGLNDGGAEAVLYRLVVNDPADTHCVVSLTDEGKYGSLLRAAGAEVLALGMPRDRVTWRGLRGLWHAMRTYDPDVVQTWMYHANLLGGVAARLAGARVVWGIHNTTLGSERSARSTRRVAHACAWLSRLVPSRIVCCAEKAREVHAAIGYATNRMVVIPNGYDLARFSPDAAGRVRLRAQWSVPPEAAVIGMVARFDPQKDHANLVAALDRLRVADTPFIAVLVGTGMNADNTALAEWIEQAGIAAHVRLLGPRDDIPAAMSALDVHVLSSYGEAFPNVLAEAMACGTPCVTTDVGDAARIVGDAGWVVPPRDPAALAGGIAEALRAWQEPGAWRARQQRARQRIMDEFGIVKMVRCYRAVWEQAMRRTH